MIISVAKNYKKAQGGNSQLKNEVEHILSDIPLTLLRSQSIGLIVMLFSHGGSLHTFEECILPLFFSMERVIFVVKKMHLKIKNELIALVIFVCFMATKAA